MAENRRNGGASYPRHLFGAGFPQKTCSYNFPRARWGSMYPLTVIRPTPKGMGKVGLLIRGTE